MIASHTLRLFVSSTFQDLRDEREYLVKKIFPDIRQICRQRGIDFIDVDLRWGITAEEARDGGALPICLREIDRCRPYFIGILGGRYGWAPDASLVLSSAEIVTAWPWLPSLLADGTSITEIEMRYGALDLSPTPNGGNAFFYFRSGEDCGADEEATTARKLEGLKDRIRSSGIPVREAIPDVEALGELVRKDLMRLIDETVPLDWTRSELSAVRSSHRAFATARRHSYLPSEPVIEQLSARVASRAAGDRDTPVIVMAPSGYGKSALMAYWSEECRQNNPGVDVIEHYVGAGSRDHIGIIRHLMLEIRDRFSITKEIPIDSTAIVAQFSEWLDFIDSPTLVVIDAVNQLRGTSWELAWLPTQIPANVHLVISTTPGEIFDRLVVRGWNVMELAPLDKAQRAQIIAAFLGEYSKSLTQRQIERIAGDEKCAVPLFLRTLIEELRVFGEHERLDERMERYLGVEDLDDLFQQVLERIERDFGVALVRDVLTLIGASRNGLMETELLEITGASRRDLSALMLGLDYHLMTHGGLHTFFHDYLRRAALDRYMRDAASQRRVHLRIAEAFARFPYDARRRDEEPWQLEQVGEGERLADCVSAIPMLRLLAPVEYRYELIDYWKGLEGQVDMVETYARRLEEYEQEHDDPDELLETLHTLGHLYIAATRYPAAETLFHRASDLTAERYGHDDPRTALALDDLGTALTHEGRYAESEQIFRDVIATRERISPNDPSLCTALDNLATVLYTLGKNDEMERVCRRSLELSERVLGSEHLETADRLQNLAAAVSRIGDHSEAIRFLEHAVAIQSRVLGQGHPDTCKTIINLGGIHHWLQNYDAAESCYRRALKKLEERFDDHPQIALGLFNLSLLYEKTDRLDLVEPMLERSVRMCLSLYGERHFETIRGFLTLGRIQFKRARYEEAEALYRRWYRPYLALTGEGNPDLMKHAEYYAEVLLALGRDDEAMELRRETASGPVAHPR